MYCDKLDLSVYLDKIMNLAQEMEKPDSIPNLAYLWLDKCQLFDFLVERLEKKRPDIYIRYHERSKLID